MRSASGTTTTTTVSLGAAGLELAGRVSTVLLPCRGRGSYNYSPSRGAFRWTCPAPAWGGRREPGPLRWLDQKAVSPRLLGEVVAHHSDALTCHVCRLAADTCGSVLCPIAVVGRE